MNPERGIYFRISLILALAGVLLLPGPGKVQARNGFSPMNDPALRESYKSARDLQTIFRAVYDYARPGVVQITTESLMERPAPNGSGPATPQSQDQECTTPHALATHMPCKQSGAVRRGNDQCGALQRV